MEPGRQVTFGQVCFDARTGELSRDQVRVKLTPRTSAVLAMLVERAEQLVTKQELFEKIWGGRAVSDDALTSCIQELRRALGDDARRPRYIETRHRRGYRLMVPVVERPSTPAGGDVRRLPAPEPATLVGRAAEMEELARRFEQALLGRRQIVFVAGEPGIGKSALVGAFLEQIVANNEVSIAYGQCLDHHGVGEPYLPLMEALTRLAGSSQGAAVKQALRSRAPSWFAQLPSLWSESERGVLEARGRPTRDRMLRELTQAIESISADRPLVLALEDIHWSDASTLDWLAHVARRPEPARLMIVATLRPAEPTATKVDLAGVMAELALHGRCHEISLRPLGLPAIETYLQVRLGETRVHEIAQSLLERTGGNPLFMVSIVNELTPQNALADAIGATPHNVRRYIERQIDDLDDSDRNLLMAASVIRRQFALPAVAAALETAIESVEVGCARLARQNVFISRSDPDVWPDGTRAELYGFRHDLYRELLYDRLPPSSRAAYHTRVANRLELVWGSRSALIAAELADHFDRGNEPVRAIPHHQRAAATALRRSANQEAISHLQRAFDAIRHVPDESERAKLEVELRVAMGAAFIATRGFGAPEVVEAYTKAEALCGRLGERADLFPALWGQWLFRHGRSEVTAARQVCMKLLSLAEKSDDAGLKLQAHHAMWATSFSGGDLAACRTHAEAGLALYDAQAHQAMASRFGNHDASTCARNFLAMSLALAGEERRARATMDDALAESRRLNDPFSLALTFFFSAVTAQLLGDVTLSTTHSDAGMRMAAEHDLAMPKAWSTGLVGWCAVRNGDQAAGLALLSDAISAMRTMQSQHFMPYLVGLLVDAHSIAGHDDDALKAAEEGIAKAEATGECFYNAELYRLRGELLARSSSHAQQAQASFHTAVEIAGKQGATMLERKARESLKDWAG